VTAEDIARAIQLILAPVVMVTACAITLGAFMGHYQAVNDRLRAMGRERLDLLQTGLRADRFGRERLAEIDFQAPDLLRRHRRLRDSVMSIDLAILLFVACMLAIAIATTTGSSGVAIGVLVLFLLGTLALLVGVLLSALEIRMSHGAVEYELDRIMSLKADSD
jgi:Flp pilus assembly protein TadB